MNKMSLAKALLCAGVVVLAGVANADAIFYPDGSSVNLSDNAVETGLTNQILALSPDTAPNGVALASLGIPQSAVPDVALVDTTITPTTVLGAGPVVTTSRLVTVPVPAAATQMQACELTMSGTLTNCRYLPG